MSNAKNLPVSITIIPPKGSEKALEFTQDSIMVGTGATAHVKLEDGDASSVHCMIKVKGDSLVVMDLGSDNGTTVNGKDVEGETKLQDGAELMVGKTRLVVHFGGHVAENATVPIRTGSKGKEQEAAAAALASETKGHKASREETDPEATARNEAPPPPPSKKDKKADKKAAAEESKPEPKKESKPAPAAAAAPKATHAPVVQEGMGDLARRMLEEELPADEKPEANNRMLEVALIWKDTVIEVRHVAFGDEVTLGNTGNPTFRMAAEGWGSGDPAVLMKSDATVTVPSGGKGVVRTGGKTRNQDSGFKLEMGERGAVTLGDVTFMMQWVAKARVIPSSPWKSMDFYFQKILASTLAAHVLLFIIFQLTPMDPDAMADDLFKNPNAFAKLILKPEELQKKKKKEDLSGKKGGAKHKDAEGKFGKKEVKQKEAASSKKGAPVVDPNKREKDRAIAFNSGVLGILKNNKGAVSNVFGPGGLGTGINNALGGLNGTSMGDAGGAGGLGTRGTGPGGGGNALGIGGLGSGTGRGSGGQGDVDLGGRGKSGTKITPGKTIVEGGLSKEEIGRVIRRYLSQIKYCYEKELTRNPNLAGKVVTSFTIGGTGKVTDCDVAETSLNDPTVEDCVVKIIKRIQFPTPKGGGIVLVSYPFIFQSSGQ